MVGEALEVWAASGVGAVTGQWMGASVVEPGLSLQEVVLRVEDLRGENRRQKLSEHLICSSWSMLVLHPCLYFFLESQLLVLSEDYRCSELR